MAGLGRMPGGPLGPVSGVPGGVPGDQLGRSRGDAEGPVWKGRWMVGFHGLYNNNNGLWSSILPYRRRPSRAPLCIP